MSELDRIIAKYGAPPDDWQSKAAWQRFGARLLTKVPEERWFRPAEFAPDAEAEIADEGFPVNNSGALHSYTCSHLVQIGWFKRVGPGQYALTPLGEEARALEERLLAWVVKRNWDLRYGSNRKKKREEAKKHKKVLFEDNNDDGVEVTVNGVVVRGTPESIRKVLGL